MPSPLRSFAVLPVLLTVAACAPRPDRAPAPGEGSAEAGVPVEAALFTGAGDIARCDGLGDDSTALLLDRTPGLVWTTGDNAYPAGTAEEFERCYGPSWGRHRHRTRPVPGNHEYWTPGARAYFAYFGEAAGEPGKGWYSYRYGEWLVVALNSNLSATNMWAEQIRWLRKLLEDNPSECTVAYFHHPLVSSGSHGSNDDVYDQTNVRPIWAALYRRGVDVVLAGHDHHYERFARMDPLSRPDPERGIRQFIVGTGGGELREAAGRHPLSRALVTDRYGVLRLTLGRGEYSWAFVGVDGRIHDRGRERCR